MQVDAASWFGFIRALGDVSEDVVQSIEKRSRLSGFLRQPNGHDALASPFMMKEVLARGVVQETPIVELPALARPTLLHSNLQR